MRQSALLTSANTIKKMKHISILPLYDATLTSIDSTYQLFSRVNDFMRYQGKELFYDIEIVGLDQNTQLGIYNISSNKTIGEVNKTDVIVLPLLCGNFMKAIE